MEQSNDDIKMISDACQGNSLLIFVRGPSTKNVTIDQQDLLLKVKHHLDIDSSALREFSSFNSHSILRFDESGLSNLQKIRESLSSFDGIQFSSAAGFAYSLRLHKDDRFSKETFNSTQFRISIILPFITLPKQGGINSLQEAIGRLLGQNGSSVLSVTQSPNNPSSFDVVFEKFPRDLFAKSTILFGEVSAKIRWPHHLCNKCKTYGHSYSRCPISDNNQLSDVEKKRYSEFMKFHERRAMDLGRREKIPKTFAQAAVNALQQKTPKNGSDGNGNKKKHDHLPAPDNSRGESRSPTRLATDVQIEQAPNQNQQQTQQQKQHQQQPQQNQQQSPKQKPQQQPLNDSGNSPKQSKEGAHKNLTPLRQTTLAESIGNAPRMDSIIELSEDSDHNDRDTRQSKRSTPARVNGRNLDRRNK